jgi:hypothetical protein
MNYIKNIKLLRNGNKKHIRGIMDSQEDNDNCFQICHNNKMAI